MSEMVERVARAICAALSDEPWEELGPHWHGVYQTEARAAIEAMREPTPEMIAACDINIPTEGTITGVWKDMIDAALA